MLRTGSARAVAVEDVAQQHPHIGKPSGVLLNEDFVFTSQLHAILTNNIHDFTRDFTNMTWGVAKMVEKHSVVAVTSTDPDHIPKTCCVCQELPRTFFQCVGCEAGVLCIPCFIQEMSSRLGSHVDGSMQFTGCPICKKVFRNVGPRYEHK
jgi:hypothetical protein